MKEYLKEFFKNIGFALLVTGVTIGVLYPICLLIIQN